MLEKKSVETEELMKKLSVDQEEASKVQIVVAKEEAVANKKADETRAIAEDAQKDLDQALPALKAANKVWAIRREWDTANCSVVDRPTVAVLQSKHELHNIGVRYCRGRCMCIKNEQIDIPHCYY